PVNATSQPPKAAATRALCMQRDKALASPPTLLNLHQAQDARASIRTVPSMATRSDQNVASRGGDIPENWSSPRYTPRASDARKLPPPPSQRQAQRSPCPCKAGTDRTVSLGWGPDSQYPNAAAALAGSCTANARAANKANTQSASSESTDLRTAKANTPFSASPRARHKPCRADTPSMNKPAVARDVNSNKPKYQGNEEFRKTCAQSVTMYWPLEK